MRKLGYLGLICVVAFATGACGDDGINTLPDGPALEDRDADGVLDSLDNCPDDANADQVNTDGDADGDACDDDDDNDGILDGADNCPIVANPDQANTDSDADGDACDGDADGDKVADDTDNCPGVANVDQINTDGDAEGDACDADDDNDTILDGADNCPLNANEDQLNSDKDGNGDACDDDDDDDTVLDVDDNCPTVANLDQANGDGDTDGDVCDTDLDNDEVANDVDNCPLDANSGQEDNDQDGAGDVCDNDDDNDGIGDEGDNCPLDANDQQQDNDSDGLGDACDADDDNDGVPDADDNCPLVPNSDQTNSDTDTLGNACDDDDDGDGVVDQNDNCPGIPNIDQADGDFDGIGDACDGIFPTVSETLTGGNIIAVGKGWSGREDGVVKADGDVTISGLPAGATIHKAFYYWTVIGAPFPSVTFEGSVIQGAEIGQAQDTCWGIGNNFMYRADVTSLVTAIDKTYTVRDILSTNDFTPDGQGGSLVLIYQDPADTRENFVKISEGAVGFVGGGTTSATATFGGFSLASNPDTVRVFNLVADGQTFAESLQIQNTEFGNGNPFFGSDGPLWDTRTDVVTPLVQTGATEVVTTISSDNDCLAWSMNALVIEKFDSAPQLPFAPTSKVVPSPIPSKQTTVRKQSGRRGAMQ